MADPTQGSGRAGAEDVKAQSEFNELLFQSSKEQEKINELLKERSEFLNLSAEQLKSEVETNNSILNALQGQLAADKQLRESQQRAAEANIDLAEKQLDLQHELANATIRRDKAAERAAEQSLAALKKQMDANQKIIDQERTIPRILDEIGKKNKDLMAIKVKDGLALKKILESDEYTEQDKIDAIRTAVGLNKEFLDLQTKMKGVSDKVAGVFGMQSDFSKTSLGSISDMLLRYNQMRKAGVGVGGAIAKIAGQTLNLKNLFGNVVDEIKKMVIQLDEVGKKLGGTTGMGNVFQSQIMTTFRSTVTGGGTMEEASSAIGNLASGFSKFNPQADAVNESLSTTIVRLQKIGVSGDQAAKTMDFFARTLRMTEQEASNLTVELSLMGQQMGLTSSQIISDFQSVSNDLAIYGKGAIDVFKDLEAQAKATGMQISALVGLAKQFDTFESAADKAAQLNAVLGTQLSSLELMNMQYDDRINYIRQEVSFAVGNLENRDQYTQQFVQQALGVSSVAEAQRLLNMNQSEYLKYQNDMAAANKRQEDLAELTKELVPVMDQFKIAIMQLALTLSPLITILAYVFDAFNIILAPISMLIEAFSGWPAMILLAVAALAALAGGILNVGFTVGLLNISLSTTQSRMIVLTAGLFIVGLIMKNTEGPIRALALGVLALGASMLFLKGASGWIHAFFFVLITALGTRINPLLVNAFHFMAIGVTTLGVAFSTIQGPAMLAMLVFSLMVGVLALFVYSLKELVVTLAESGDGLFNAAAGMYAISGAITALGASMLILAATGGLFAISKMANSMEKMGQGFQNTADGLERISKMSVALSNLGNNGLIAISAEGNKVNAVMGTGDVLNNFSAGKIQVDVNLPEQQTPNIDLKVELMGKQLVSVIKEVIGYSG
jgi:hypothetical protein